VIRERNLAAMTACNRAKRNHGNTAIIENRFHRKADYTDREMISVQGQDELVRLRQVRLR
jgi:hypothetical protein